MEAAAEVLIEGGALDVVVYDTPEAMRNAWSVRRAVPETILETYEKVEECDIVVPISHIAEVVEAAKAGPFLSKDDFRDRSKVSQTIADKMAELGLLGDLPDSNQISIFDWMG